MSEIIDQIKSTVASNHDDLSDYIIEGPGAVGCAKLLCEDGHYYIKLKMSDTLTPNYINVTDVINQLAEILKK